MTKISIIMPVYNGERWLDESISSVIFQTFNDFELICVDDSSTDNSSEIIKNFVNQDSRIKYFKKENGGSSAALNYGVEQSIGEYLCFIDQDDKYDKTYLEKMYNTIVETGLDVGICNGFYWQNDNLKPLYNKKLTKKIINISNLLSKKKFAISYLPQWTKIVKRSFWIENKIEFPSRENKTHDIPVHYILVGLCDKIANIDECLYYHRIHPNQITANVNSFVSYMTSLQNIFTYLDCTDIPQKQKSKIRKFALRCLLKKAYKEPKTIISLSYIYTFLKNNRKKLSLKYLFLLRLLKIKIKFIQKRNKFYLQPMPCHNNFGINTYCATIPCIISPETTIGKFCSIGENVKIGHGNHPTNYLSTSPYFYFDNLGWKTTEANSHNEFWKVEPCRIGNDVWIGDNVSIKNGVTIGDGAIIGLGAVVTKDVPPYAIVAGVPAKIIRYRFDKEIIDKLLKLKWWDLNENTIRKIPYDDINKAIEFLEKQRGVDNE